MKFSIALVILSLPLLAATVPNVDEIPSMAEKTHPRIFINQKTLPAFKSRLTGVCGARLADLKKEVDNYPEKVELEYKTENVDIIDGKMVFKRRIGDQNAVSYGLKRCGGYEALKCALVYLGYGDSKYLQKANDYLQLSVQFVKLAQKSRILPEWYHYSRQSALIAYDWLHDDLSDEQRRSFIVPMVEYVDYMQTPHGYQRNSGDVSSGNYGEPGLMWYAGLAALNDGYVDALALKLLKNGYQQTCKMMDKRESMSAGTGLLMHITTGYVFGAYPWASCNFLHSLKSALNLDLTEHWTQMRDYPMFFSWMSIANSQNPNAFHEYGWGDSGHTSNNMDTWLMYNHMAQVIHLYGNRYPEAAKKARAVIEMLPPRQRRFNDLHQHAYLPFILSDFNPEEKNAEPPSQVLSQDLAMHFKTFGLTIMRSGFSDGDTYASIKAGSPESQHQHYDENSFIIYKRGFQALDTGTRNNAPHHLIYYPQSIAHNTILIRTPAEQLAPHWYPANAPRITAKPFADGGQDRMTTAHSLGFDMSDYHAVTGGDATACYSATKCKEAVRQFVFVKPDYFVVYDRVTSMQPTQQKVFLLHTEGEPTQNDGIWRSAIGGGALFTKTLLPTAVKTDVIGGKDHEYVAGGINYPIAADSWVANAKGQTWTGKYRLEIYPKEDHEKVRFLHLLQASEASQTGMVASHVVTTDTQDGVAFTLQDGKECTVMFNRDGLIGGSITLRKNGRILLERPLLEERPVGPQASRRLIREEAARIDVYMKDGSLDSVDHGNALTFDRPNWLNNGDSFVAEFAGLPGVQRGNFTIKALNNGTLVVKLKGPDIRIDGVFQPYMVDFKSFNINGKPYLTQPLRVWHNKERIFEIPIKAGEILKLEASFTALGKQQK